MSDCRCLNVDDVLRNLNSRVATNVLAKIDKLPDAQYVVAREALRDALWEIFWYRQEIEALQTEVRNETRCFETPGVHAEGCTP